MSIIAAYFFVDETACLSGPFRTEDQARQAEAIYNKYMGLSTEVDPADEATMRTLLETNRDLTEQIHYACNLQ